MCQLKTNARHYNAVEEYALNSIMEDFLEEVIVKVTLG